MFRAVGFSRVRTFSSRGLAYVRLPVAPFVAIEAALGAVPG